MARKRGRHLCVVPSSTRNVSEGQARVDVASGGGGDDEDKREGQHDNIMAAFSLLSPTACPCTVVGENMVSKEVFDFAGRDKSSMVGIGGRLSIVGPRTCYCC